MKISVVIPTYNRKHVLAKTLPTVLGQNLSCENYEVIVVVDGSSDGTGEWLRQKRNPKLRIIEQSNQGPAIARNNGVSAANGNLVLFLDDDIICDSDLMHQHVIAHAAADIPMVAHGRLAVAAESTNNLATDTVRAWYENHYGQVTPEQGIRFPEHIFGIANSSMAKSTFLASGGFDKNIPFPREDFELGLRLWKMNVQFRYAPKAIAYEIYTKSSRDYARLDAVGLGRAEVALCRKHPDYRPYSVLAPLGGGSLLTRLLRPIVLARPVSADLMLGATVWLAERLRFIPRVGRWGVNILGLQHRIATLRSAMQEAGSWKVVRREFGARLSVLMYHHIGPKRAGCYPDLTITPREFESQIRWLAKNDYVAIRASQWLRWYRVGELLPPKAVLLTFDDAYKDICDYALPILKRYGFSAVIFVVTSRMGTTNKWDEALGIGTLPLMTAEQIRYWATEGIEFGAHSRTHADLTTLSVSDLVDEVAGSRRELEQVLARPLFAFSYPYGFFNQIVTESVKHDFEMAFSVQEGLNSIQSNLHLLRRTMVQPTDSLLEFAWRVRFGWNPLERLRNRAQVFTQRIGKQIYRDKSQGRQCTEAVSTKTRL